MGKVFRLYSDFLYYCHYTQHNTESLNEMQQCLNEFQAEAREQLAGFHNTGFRTPKFHILSHYMEMIHSFGSLMHGDTEIPERMHVSFKKAFRNTNKKDNYDLQVARNLDEELLVDLLVKKVIGPGAMKAMPIHGTLSGKIESLQKADAHPDERLEPYLPSLKNYLLGFHRGLRLEDCKVSTWSTVKCLYQDVTSTEGPLQCFARATSKWAHRPDGEIYDFVLCDEDDDAERLCDYQAYQLHIIIQVHAGSETFNLVLGEEWSYNEMLDDVKMAAYSCPGTYRWFPSTSIVRTVQMVPIDDERMILNSHTDKAAWSAFY